MSVSNFVKTTLKSNISDSATSIDVDTATSPFSSPPSAGTGFLVDSIDAPTKWEEISWTGRSSISGGFSLTGVTRNVDSSTGAAQAFDAGNFVTQAPSGTQRTGADNKVVTGTAGSSGQVSSWNADGDLVGKGVTGNDANVVTGTAGTNGNLAQWNSDGDAVDSGLQTANTPQTDTANTFTAVQTFNSGNMKVGEMIFRHESATVNDDATHAFSLSFGANLTVASLTAGFSYNALFWPAINGEDEISSGSNVSFGSGSNPDVDTDMNIWVSSGVINIKNRTGAQRTVHLLIITP